MTPTIRCSKYTQIPVDLETKSNMEEVGDREKIYSFLIVSIQRPELTTAVLKIKTEKLTSPKL